MSTPQIENLEIVIPTSLASVVTTNLQLENDSNLTDASAVKYISSSFFNHPSRRANHQTTNPYIGAAASSGASIVTSNVSFGSLPAAQLSRKPFDENSDGKGPTSDPNNVMPNGSTMIGYPSGNLPTSGAACQGNQQPCYDGTSTNGNQPIFRKAELIGLTGQNLYHFSMDSSKSVSNHSSIFYNTLIEKALTNDGHQVSPGFTVSH